MGDGDVDVEERAAREEGLSGWGSARSWSLKEVTRVGEWV